MKGTGGWLGFTDNYWASAIIPGQTKTVSPLPRLGPPTRGL